MNGNVGWALGRGGVSYQFLTVFVLAPGSLRARRLAEQRWERLVEAYPDHLQDLETTFGRHLHEQHPSVRSDHSRERLRFAGGGARLEMALDEPLRRPLGWGGVRLRAWRGEAPLRLPATDLFLTLLRGNEPEWVAQVRGFPLHRLIVIDAAAVAHLCTTVFAAPAKPGVPA